VTILILKSIGGPRESPSDWGGEKLRNRHRSTNAPRQKPLPRSLLGTVALRTHCISVKEKKTRKPRKNGCHQIGPRIRSHQWGWAVTKYKGHKDVRLIREVEMTKFQSGTEVDSLISGRNFAARSGVNSRNSEREAEKPTCLRKQDHGKQIEKTKPKIHQKSVCEEEDGVLA